jgi:O-acetylserine/cysteine efflux transporter
VRLSGAARASVDGVNRTAQLMRLGRPRPSAGEGMHRSALAALTAAGLMFGLTVPLSKVALGWLAPAWLAAVRFGLAAPVLAVVARRTLRPALTPRVALWGALGYGAMVVLQNLGVERTSVTHAAIIFGAVPVFVAAGTALAGRAAAGPAAYSGFGVALAGVALVAGSGGQASVLGDALVVASAVLGSALIVVQGELLEGRDPVAVTAVQMGAAGLFALVFALPTALPAGPPRVEEAIALTALVSVGSLIPFSLYAYGQARVSAEMAGAFVNLEPVVGVAAGVLAFGNPFGSWQALGAVLVIAGLALSAGASGRRRSAYDPCPGCPAPGAA